MTRFSLMTVIGVAAFALTATAGVAREGNRPTFEQIDSNGDGEISGAELSAVNAARFAARDTNGDGFLDREELEAAAAKRSAVRINRMMRHVDSDGDGQLSQEEIAARRDPARMLSRFDADGSGTLSKAEFEGARKAMRGRMAEHRGAKRSGD